MPIFNSEENLPRTINSIINQTIGFKKLELILIDDKSTDNTRNVIENYANQYNNIIPIYLNKNSGHPGIVRNVGLTKATSDYIMFIDSDDEYDENLCKILYDTIINEKCDLVGCNHIKIDNITKSYTKIDGDDEKIYFNPKNSLYYTDMYAWNKIFKKSIIDNNNIQFITKHIGEDTIFCLEYILNSEAIVHLNNYYGYTYYNIGDSFSTENMKWIINVIEHDYDIFNILKEHLMDIDIDKFFQGKINYLIYCLISLKENEWKTMSYLINKTYILQKDIKYTGKYENNIIYKTINKFIISNHLTLTTLIVFILNKIHRNKFILRYYRKLILKDNIK